jgi:hypothetical protein
MPPSFLFAIRTKEQSNGSRRQLKNLHLIWLIAMGRRAKKTNNASMLSSRGAHDYFF